MTVRRELVQQAKTFDIDKHNPAGMYMSEKYDGMRAWWDGGVSRGKPTVEVPWAGITDPKTMQQKDKIKPLATGLWSRYGNPIMAPGWWLDQLPLCPLDGELWVGRGCFQETMSIVRRDVPDDRWKKVKFSIYGAPPKDRLFGSGLVKNTNCYIELDSEANDKYIKQNQPLNWHTWKGPDFASECNFIASHVNGEVAVVHSHILLPPDQGAAIGNLMEFSKQVVDQGGEGIVLRRRDAVWTPKRVQGCLKMKPFLDGTAVVTGFTTGALTTKGSKARGLIGALVLSFNGSRLELSGMNYGEERQFETEAMTKWAWEHPGKDAPSDFKGRIFKPGDTVNFKYRELSKDGIPKEARLWRKTPGGV